MKITSRIMAAAGALLIAGGLGGGLLAAGSGAQADTTPSATASASVSVSSGASINFTGSGSIALSGEAGTTVGPASLSYDVTDNSPSGFYVYLSPGAANLTDPAGATMPKGALEVQTGAGGQEGSFISLTSEPQLTLYTMPALTSGTDSFTDQYQAVIPTGQAPGVYSGSIVLTLGSR